ncbi:hypothetical protein L5515_016879 [Caenorhabditis briggsae]|uniref:Saposin B-type domain-containing protein n=1 Tax=Caenorhabditis briggsae TaxID=6238 RepID=A0AAE8ZP23_CAEBR|nr:hypothetical protein L3Y34_010999 [Caenorhabditis briggsae]UMM40117.1 hypothetical protein L5515_016879 [Caenorhabditis briggsae]
MRITIFLVFLICGVLIQEVHGLRMQNCDYCVKVLQCVYGQLRKSVRSKRLLGSKLTHTCKRYPEYKRSCLKFSKAHLLTIYNDMQPEKYDPRRICTEVQECASIPLASVNEQ